MDLKISKYKNYLQKFSNVVLGSSVIALLLSLQAPPSNFNLFIKQVFIFTIMFLAILHGWWRNSELYTSAKAKTSGVYVAGTIRIFLLLLSILWIRSQSIVFGIAPVQFQILFGILAISLWVGFIPQAVFLKPLYGRERVFHRRALLTDLFYAVSATLFVVGLTFLPSVFGSLWGAGLLLVAIALSRGIAIVSTRWSEPLPPHRGGRGRRHDPRRQDSGASRGRAGRRTTERRPTAERHHTNQKKNATGRRTSGERRPSRRASVGTPRERKPSTATVKENSSAVNGSNKTQRTRKSVTTRRARSTKPPDHQAPKAGTKQEKDSPSEVQKTKARYGRGKSRRSPKPSTIES